MNRAANISKQEELSLATWLNSTALIRRRLDFGSDIVEFVWNIFYDPVSESVTKKLLTEIPPQTSTNVPFAVHLQANHLTRLSIIEPNTANGRARFVALPKVRIRSLANNTFNVADVDAVLSTGSA